jgi:hypothetical protein
MSSSFDFGGLSLLEAFFSLEIFFSDFSAEFLECGGFLELKPLKSEANHLYRRCS